MKLLSLLTVLTLFIMVHSDDSSCSMDYGCGDKIWNMKSLLNTFSNSTMPPTLPMLKVIKSHCDEARDCYKNCRNEFKEYENSCETISTKLHEIDTECIVPVLDEIYSGKTLCTKNFDFFTTSHMWKRKIYADGKDCFLRIAKTLCYRSHFDPLVENYDRIMDAYTMRPEYQGTCTTPFFKFQKLQCEAMKNGMPAKLEKLNMKENPDEEVAKLLKETKECLDLVACEDGRTTIFLDDWMIGAAPDPYTGKRRNLAAILAM